MTELDRQLREILLYEQKIKIFFSVRRVGEQNVEDLTQEVICRIFESLERFRGDASLGTWIYSICRHVLYDFKRKNSRFDPLELPEIAVDDGLALVELNILVESLPAYLKQIYDRKYRQGMKIREISRELSIPEGTVKYYLFQIREKLKSIYLPLRERYT